MIKPLHYKNMINSLFLQKKYVPPHKEEFEQI